MKRSSFGRKAPPTRLPDQVDPETGRVVRAPSDRAVADAKVPDHKAAAQRAVLNALRKAKRAADRAGVELSTWEDEFLGSVSDRIKTYGRAFADPEKGDPRAPLSVLQAVKLKEITAKAKGEKDKRFLPRAKRGGGGPRRGGGG